MLIFLDIDGVMIPERSWEKQVLLGDGFPAFSSKATHALRSLLNVNTTLMLTTSHKSKFSTEQWKEIFANRGLEIERISTLADNRDNLSRLGEIKEWFNEHNLEEDFIILDDDKSLNDLPIHLKKNLILTSPLVGLTENDLTPLLHKV